MDDPALALGVEMPDHGRRLGEVLPLQRLVKQSIQYPVGRAGPQEPRREGRLGGRKQRPRVGVGGIDLQRDAHRVRAREGLGERRLQRHADLEEGPVQCHVGVMLPGWMLVPLFGQLAALPGAHGVGQHHAQQALGRVVRVVVLQRHLHHLGQLSVRDVCGALFEQRLEDGAPAVDRPDARRGLHVGGVGHGHGVAFTHGRVVLCRRDVDASSQTECPLERFNPSATDAFPWASNVSAAL